MSSRLFIALALLALSTQVRAGCEQVGLVEQIAKNLHPAQKIDADLSACKTWPYDPSLTIVALAIVLDDDPQAGSHEFDMHLLLLKSGTHEVVASFLQPKAWTSDAVGLESVSIDAGRYQIGRNLRAFGVRAHYVGQSRPNPYSADTLSLYVAEADRLRPVLQNLIIAFDRGEWDMNCSGEFETRTRTISLSPSASGAYRDLVLLESSKETTSRMVDGDCKDTVGASTRSSLLKFADGQYAVPAELRWD